MSARRGFTLVELMIIVALLGILAAIVIPEFGSNTSEAKTSALCSDLATIRKQIELYRYNHQEQLPAAVGETGDDFTRRLTTKTDGAGNAGAEFGPYFQRMPVNPFNNLATVRVGDAAAGANTHGWRFDPVSGQFLADDSTDTDADGVLDHVGL
ncbi:MAG: prepilin-type N-terminal cleavage/methylation domain-containing protein [Solirubrobacterales bacterium]